MGYIMTDAFTGITIDTSKWTETDANNVITQNNTLSIDCEAASNQSLFDAKLQSVQNITSGVAVVQANVTWTGDSTNEPQAGIVMYVDSSNYAILGTRTTGGGAFRGVIVKGGVSQYSIESAITKGKDVKITYDVSGHDIKFWYWSGAAWTQIGTTQNQDIGSTVYFVLSGTIGTTPSEGVDPLTVDDAYFSQGDYSTQYPTQGNLSVSVSDTVTVSESIQISYSLPSPIIESVTVSESIQIGYSLPSPIIESVTVSESIQISYSLPSPIIESVTVSESVSIVIVSLVPSVSDTVTVSESIQISYSLPSPIIESVTVSESFSVNLSTSLPLISDTVTVSESIQISYSLPSPIIESVTVSEGVIIFIPTVLPSVSDTVTVSESIQISYSLPSPIIESVTVSESIQISYSLPSPIIESVTVSESFTFLITNEPSLNETITVSENTQLIVISLMSVFDSVTASENFSSDTIIWEYEPPQFAPRGSADSNTGLLIGGGL